MDRERHVGGLLIKINDTMCSTQLYVHNAHMNNLKNVSIFLRMFIAQKKYILVYDNRSLPLMYHNLWHVAYHVPILVQRTGTIRVSVNIVKLCSE